MLASVNRESELLDAPPAPVIVEAEEDLEIEDKKADADPVDSDKVKSEPGIDEDDVLEPVDHLVGQLVELLDGAAELGEPGRAPRHLLLQLAVVRPQALQLLGGDRECGHEDHDVAEWPQ